MTVCSCPAAKKLPEFCGFGANPYCESVEDMIDFTKKSRYTFEDFVEVVRLLRSPGGCPWDQVQTHQSIRRNFLEETYECCEAIDNDDLELMKEELGDVMMQVIFHASIEADRGRFTIDDVCDGAVKKLVFRHPNVFGPKTEQTWDDMKALEKGQMTGTATLDAVARSLPALWRAEKLVKKAEKTGFAWPDLEGRLEHLKEETAELKQAVEEQSNVEEELGDVLFSAVCAAAKAGIDPEMALHSACEKFISRYSAMEQAADAQGRSLEAYTPAEQLALWQDTKHREA